MQHILLVADRISNSDQAGTVRAFVERLGHRGLAAGLLCTSWSAPGRDGLEVDECRWLGDRWRLTWALRSLRRPDGPARPRLIHAVHASVGPAALELAERWRVPYLQVIDEFPAPGSRLRLSRRWCRAVIATSRELYDDLTRNFGLPPAAVRVIHRGLEPVEPVAARWAVDRDQVPVIGAAGALVAGSGFSTLLNAARRVLDAGIDAEFVIVGEGEDEDDLRRRADRLRLTERLTFAGDAAVGLSFWDVLDVYCQPSTVPTVGRSLARAMSHGLPAVASDIEGLRSLVIHGVTGLRVPPNDSNALARAILDLLADRPRAARFGLDARSVVLRDYDLDREAALFAGLYEEVIESEAEPSAR